MYKPKKYSLAALNSLSGLYDEMEAEKRRKKKIAEKVMKTKGLTEEDIRHKTVMRSTEHGQGFTLLRAGL